MIFCCYNIDAMEYLHALDHIVGFAITNKNIGSPIGAALVTFTQKQGLRAVSGAFSQVTK